MFGKPEWFTYRIFGWGIRPKTWQGWVYLLAWVAALALVSALPLATQAKAILLGVLIAVLVIDSLHIMMQLPKVSDERENHHQLIIERNCSFAAVLALLVVALYQSWQNAWMPVPPFGLTFDWGLLAVLVAMALVKAASYAYVKWRM